MKKRLWQEPVVKSIDQCQPIFGACEAGSSPSTSGPIICAAGTGGKAPLECFTGNGANTKCGSGNGAKKQF